VINVLCVPSFPLCAVCHAKFDDIGAIVLRAVEHDAVLGSGREGTLQHVEQIKSRNGGCNRAARPCVSQLVICACCRAGQMTSPGPPCASHSETAILRTEPGHKCWRWPIGHDAPLFLCRRGQACPVDGWPRRPTPP